MPFFKELRIAPAPFCRAALAIIYVWFGALKLIGESPARELVAGAVPWLPENVTALMLGSWEVAIGIGLLLPLARRHALLNIYLHLAATTLPLLVLPEACFLKFPYAPTIVGQYIVKNIALLGAALTAWDGLKHDSIRPERQAPISQAA